MANWWLFSLLFPLSLFAFALQEAEGIALQNNPQILAAEEVVQRAKQGKLESVSKLLPQFSVLTEYFRMQTPLKLLGLNQSNAFFTEFSLSQTLFALDMIQDVKLAALNVNLFDYLLQAARNDILLRVRILYYLVALDQKKISTAKEHIRLLNSLAERMQYKYDIGEATLYNVNQARVAAINVTDAYYQATKQLKTDQDELTRTLGYDPSAPPTSYTQTEILFDAIPELIEKVEAAKAIFEGEKFILVDQFSDLEEKVLTKVFPPEEFLKWNTYADELRPDIQIGKNYIQMAHQAVIKSKADYFPKFDLLFNYGGAPSPYLEQPETRFNNQFMQWGVGVALNWNLFDSMGRERRVKKAKYEQRAVSFDYQKTVQAAHVDVREQLYRMQKALAKYLTASANLKLAEQTLQQVDSQLDIGYVTIYDYMISVDGLIRAQTSLDEGKFEVLAAYYSLLHASGKELLYE